MTERERFLTVLGGGTPDKVPWFADLSYWFNALRCRRFVPSPDKDIDHELIALHSDVRAGICKDLGAVIEPAYDSGGIEDIQHIEGDTFTWTLRTPIGELREIRVYNESSFSWDIVKRMIESPVDLPIIRYAMERKSFVPRFDRYSKIAGICGVWGVPFAHGIPYSGLGFFMSRFMGVENTVYALADEPVEMAKTIALINEVNLTGIDLICESPAEVVLLSDNFSSDLQPPRLFNEFTASYVVKAAEKLHDAGKYLALHLDGRARGLLACFTGSGVDLVDALTPKPTGDMTPAEIRDEAGPDIVLSGGVSPVYWLPERSDREFVTHVREWLDLRRISPRLVMSDGDQVPPGTSIERIRLMREIIDEYGLY